MEFFKNYLYLPEILIRMCYVQKYILRSLFKNVDPLKSYNEKTELGVTALQFISFCFVCSYNEKIQMHNIHTHDKCSAEIESAR